MKKLLTVLCIFLIMTAAVSCKKQNESTEIFQEEKRADTAEKTETSDNENKSILKLQNYSEIGSSSEMQLSATPAISPIETEIPELPETGLQPYSDEEYLQLFVDYTKNELDAEIDDRWQYFIHYTAADISCGMVEFRYFIGEIQTDKSVIFSFENGMATMCYHNFLEKNADEADLLRRVELFRQKYVQEKYELKDGEKLESDDVHFSYYFGSEKLVYSYTVFFSYGDYSFINNDYMTECFIDQDGNAEY